MLFRSSYSFTVTTSDNYVANFSQISYAVVASADPSEGGTVTGSGVYFYGTTASLTATANANYSFV